MDMKLEVTPEAITTMEHCCNRVEEIGQKLGYDSPEFIRANQTWRHSMMQMFRLGGRITASGEFGDFCLDGNSFIQYGVIFFPKDREDRFVGEWSVHS